MADKECFDSLEELRAKFRDVFFCKKKVKALENYAETGKSHESPYIKLIRKCIRNGFVSKEESHFLSHMLRKLGIDWLDWSHKTPWLKSEIAYMRRAAKYRCVQPTLFNLDKIRSQTAFPTGLNIPAKAPAKRLHA